MPYSPAVGDALLMPSDNGGEEHMFVIIASANIGKPGHSFLLVNFSSVKAGCYVDQACVVSGNKTHHEFLRKESFVAYNFAVIMLAADLSSKVDKGIFKLLDPVSKNLLLRIGRGVAKTDRIPRKHRAYFIAYTGG